jgi:hypothetical protein
MRKVHDFGYLDREISAQTGVGVTPSYDRAGVIEAIATI